MSEPPTNNLGVSPSIASAVMAGFLPATAALLLCSAGGAPLSQNGSSFGKWVFFIVWILATQVGYRANAPRRLLAKYLSVTACLLISATGVQTVRWGFSAWESGPSRVVNLVFLFLAALFLLMAKVLVHLDKQGVLRTTEARKP